MNFLSRLFTTQGLLSLVAGFICFLFSLPVHECAHGYVAYKLGDPTAKNMGRLTLNPFKHMDLLGTIGILFFGIGWAKPVQINAYNFKNPKKGMAISAAAGPISNLLMALLFMILYKVNLMAYALSGGNTFLEMLEFLLYEIVWINILLAIFNLIPVPPFDGSRIVNCVLSERTYFKIMQYEQYIMIGMLVILFTGVLDTPLNIATEWVFTLLDKMTFFMDFLLQMVVS